MRAQSILAIKLIPTTALILNSKKLALAHNNITSYVHTMNFRHTLAAFAVGALVIVPPLAALAVTTNNAILPTSSIVSTSATGSTSNDAIIATLEQLVAILTQELNALLQARQQTTQTTQTITTSATGTVVTLSPVIVSPVPASIITPSDTMTGAGTDTSVVVPPITAKLSFGYHGPQVVALQEFLTQQGFFSDQITGYYGPKTEAAVAAFQTSQGLEPVGYVGSKTLAAIKAILSGGSSSLATAATPPIDDSTPSGLTPPTITFSASPTTVTADQVSNLTWTSSNASSCIGTAGFPASGTSGSTSVFPTVTTNYSITCTGTGGSTSANVTVTVTGVLNPSPGGPPPSPTPTVTISASPSSVTTGGGSTLTWSSTDATSCTASGAWSGAQSTSGTQSLTNLTSTGTYTLSCTGAGGTANQSVTITVTTPAPTVTIAASPSSVVSGNSSTLTWSSTNASSCSASGAWSGAQSTSGSVNLTNLTSTGTYTLSCTGAGGTANQSVTITVTAVNPAPTVTLTASPTSITSGSSSTLTWASTGATSCTASGFTASGTSGSATVSPTVTTNYSITCTGSGGTANANASVTVVSGAAPTVTLTADATAINSGQVVTLTWSPSNATSCTGTGFVASAVHSYVYVAPAVNTTYSINCTGPGGTASASVTVTVTSGGGPVPTATISASPTSITSGQTSTLTWTSTNAKVCIGTGFLAFQEQTPGTSGVAQVAPTATQNYILTCTGTGGSTSVNVTVSVSQAVGSPPVVTLTASPTLVSSGQSSTLTWTSTNATSCTGTGFTASGTSGSVTVNPTSTTNYSISCTGTGGTGSATATVAFGTVPTPTVTLTATPSIITSGQSATLAWSSTNATSCTGTGFTASATSGSASVSPTATRSYSISCTGPGGTASATVTVNLSSGMNPVVNLSVSPSTVYKGQSATLTWTSINATSCTAINFTASGTSGSVTITPAGTLNYSISCSNAAGTKSQNSQVAVTVIATAPTLTFTASPISISPGQSSTLTWSSSNTYTCTGIGFNASGVSGQVTVSPTTSTGYGITCTGAGSISANTAVVVGAAPVVPAATASPPSLEVYPGCAIPPANPTGNIWYIDPVYGSASGDGSQAHPWNSLQSLTSNAATYSNHNWETSSCQTLPPSSALYTRCQSGALLSTAPYYHDDPVAGWITSTNPNAPIKPGDTIMLMSGNYGNVTINGPINSNFITIKAALGQTPVLTSLKVSSNKLAFTNLTIEGLSPVNNGQLAVFSNSTDIVFSGNILDSQPDVSGWSISDWKTYAARSGIIASASGPTLTQSCFAITNNLFRNIQGPVGIEANNVLFSGNVVNNFGDDATDVIGNNIIYSHNFITNSHDLLDGNHNDGLQMAAADFEVKQNPTYSYWFTNWVVDSNVVIAQTDPNLPFPANGMGSDGDGLQCYGFTHLNGYTITNNICVIPDFNGIWGGSMNNGVIANNTLVGNSVVDPTGASGHHGVVWISLLGGTNVVVRNNITTSTGLSAASLQGEGMTGTVVADHNIAATPDMFRTFDPANFLYDLRPANGSPTIGGGIPDQAPTVDYTGAARGGSYDVGAISYVPYSTNTYVPFYSLWKSAPLSSAGTGVSSQVAGAAAAPNILSNMSNLLQGLLNILQSLK